MCDECCFWTLKYEQIRFESISQFNLKMENSIISAKLRMVSNEVRAQLHLSTCIKNGKEFNAFGMMDFTNRLSISILKRWHSLEWWTSAVHLKYYLLWVRVGMDSGYSIQCARLAVATRFQCQYVLICQKFHRLQNDIICNRMKIEGRIKFRNQIKSQHEWYGVNVILCSARGKYVTIYQCKNVIEC